MHPGVMVGSLIMLQDMSWIPGCPGPTVSSVHPYIQVFLHPYTVGNGGTCTGRAAQGCGETARHSGPRLFCSKMTIYFGVFQFCASLETRCPTFLGEFPGDCLDGPRGSDVSKKAMVLGFGTVPAVALMNSKLGNFSQLAESLTSFQLHSPDCLCPFWVM